MEKLRIGVIGVRGRGGIARHWHDSGRAVVVAGADVNERNLDLFRKDINPDAFITTDYRVMLERPDIDAVAVTSPDFVHEEHAVAALEAGKHVFCEKPLAITIAGCDRILRTWQSSGKELMVGFNMRYMNIFRVMKEIVDSGTIGEIKAVWVRHFVGYGGDFYYHDWHGTRRTLRAFCCRKARTTSTWSTGLRASTPSASRLSAASISLVAISPTISPAIGALRSPRAWRPSQTAAEGSAPSAKRSMWKTTTWCSWRWKTG